jgi:hypothetical protein
MGCPGIHGGRGAVDDAHGRGPVQGARLACRVFEHGAGLWDFSAAVFVGPRESGRDHSGTVPATNKRVKSDLSRHCALRVGERDSTGIPLVSPETGPGVATDVAEGDIATTCQRFSAAR